MEKGCCACKRSCIPNVVLDSESVSPENGGIPLTLISGGTGGVIVRLGGNRTVKTHLTSLGFSIGSSVSVVRKNGTDIIVNVRGSRIAMESSVASKLYVVPEATS